MISARQIDAAMRLTSPDPINGGELAALAGITPAALSAILSGKSNPKPATLTALQNVLEGRGVEFLPRDGVARRDDFVRRIEGKDGALRLMDDIYYSLNGKKNAEALFLLSDPTISSPEISAANDRLRSAGIKLRFVIPEGTPDIGKHKLECRVVPRKYNSNEPVVVYGDRYAATTSLNGEFTAIVVHHAAGADMFKKLFELTWDHAVQAR